MSDNSKKEDSPARRKFLNLAITSTATALGIVGGYPALRFLAPTASASEKRVEVGKLDEFPVSSSRSVLFGERAALVIRLPDGSFRAYVAVCTHLQCVVAYSSERNRIECRCHDGVYSIEGENVSGPPPKPLQALRVTVVEGIVVVSEA